MWNTNSESYKIHRGAGEARSSDIGAISRHLGSLLNRLSPYPDPLLITDGRDVRANRGIEHDTCLRLMLPIDLEDTQEYVISPLCQRLLLLSSDMI